MPSSGLEVKHKNQRRRRSPSPRSCILVAFLHLLCLSTGGGYSETCSSQSTPASARGKPVQEGPCDLERGPEKETPTENLPAHGSSRWICAAQSGGPWPQV